MKLLIHSQLFFSRKLILHWSAVWLAHPVARLMSNKLDVLLSPALREDISSLVRSVGVEIDTLIIYRADTGIDRDWCEAGDIP